jgi:putative endonuclease
LAKSHYLILVIPAKAGTQGFTHMQRDFQPTVYLLASRRNGTLYTGVTSNLMARIHQHREGTFGGFTHRHGITMLVWFEQHETMESAILREKRIKKWNRDWRLRLIETDNSGWRDLAEDLGFPRRLLPGSPPARG